MDGRVLEVPFTTDAFFIEVLEVKAASADCRDVRCVRRALPLIDQTA